MIDHLKTDAALRFLKEAVATINNTGPLDSALTPAEPMMRYVWSGATRTLAAAEVVAALEGKPSMYLPLWTAQWVQAYGEFLKTHNEARESLRIYTVKAVLKIKTRSRLAEKIDDSGQTQAWHEVINDLLRRLGASEEEIKSSTKLRRLDARTKQKLKNGMGMHDASRHLNLQGEYNDEEYDEC